MFTHLQNIQNSYRFNQLRTVWSSGYTPVIPKQLRLPKKHLRSVAEALEAKEKKNFKPKLVWYKLPVVTCLSFALFLNCFSTLAGTNPTLTAAQNDFKKVNQSYLNTPNMSMDTYYSVYSEHDSQSLLEGKNGKYIKYGKNTYTKIDDIEMLALGDKLISINKESKLISIGDNKELVLEPMQNNMDSLLLLCTDIKVEQINANQKSYQLYFNQSEVTEFSRVDVHIDTQNYRYLKLVLYYAMQINLKSDFYAEEKQPRMEITYSNFTILKTQPALFNEALYLSYNKNKFMPGPGYNNYKVSDLRNKTRIKTR